MVGCFSLNTGRAETTEWGPAPESLEQGRAFAHYLAAVLHENRGRPKDALEEMEQASELDPRAFTPTLRLIRAYIRGGDYEQAQAMIERALEQEEQNTNLWVLLGEVHQKLKHFDEADAAFRKAVALQPSNALGYGALAELYENTNDLVSAIEVYERLIGLSPKAAGLHYQLGINLARIGDAEAARQSLDQALRLNPKLSRAMYLIGLIAMEHDSNTDAVAYLNRYLRKRPQDTQAVEYLAGCSARLGRHEDGLRLFERLADAASMSPEQHVAHMYLTLLAGRSAEVEALAPPTGAPALSSLLTAMARQDLGQPHLPLLEGLDEIETDIDAEINGSLSNLLYLYGQEATGEWLLGRIRPFRAEAPSLALGLFEARLLISLEREAEAAPVLEALLDAFGSSRWIHYYLAMSYEGLKDFDNTEKHLEAYLDLFPDDPEALNFLGYLYAEHNVKLNEAKELIERALEFEPESAFYLDSLGWVYYQKGRADKAIPLIQKSIHLMDNDDAVLRDHLGDAYLLNGEVDKAREEWRRAHRLDPELEGVAEKLEAHRDASENGGE